MDEARFTDNSAKRYMLMQKQRRTFIKLSAAGAAGLTLLRTNRAFAAWPSSGKLEINPKISNLRVVACNDSAMMKSTPKTTDFSGENTAVDSARVQANMDAMAMSLAQETTPDAAWKAIFRSSKPWESTLVAIKINVIEPRNMPRIAVIEKFCRLFAGFGVPAGNIIVYDGNTQYGSGISNYKTYFSTTDTSKIPGVLSNYSDSLGGTTSAKLPDGSSADCTKDIASGKVDILVNIAVNKGHSLHGGSTLSMKNHFGTFAPNHTNLASYVLAINKSDAIVGGDPVRQQLCFVDSLFANKKDTFGAPDAMPCYLIMGTFGGAVDYLTVKKVREAVLSTTHDSAIVNNFVTSFGYTTSDPQWITVPPASVTPNPGTGGIGGGTGGSTGNPRDAGSDDAKGTGGTGAGGSRATGGAGSGGASGMGGAGTGGRVSGGAGGSTKGSGGVGSGGTSSSSGGRGGSGGSASSVASGGAGGGSGGTIASGGSGGSGSDGSGGASSSSAASSGGVTTSGGSSGSAEPGSDQGCACKVGSSARGGGSGMGLALMLGALFAGQLRRLFVRRETLAEADCRGDNPSSSTADVTGEKSGDVETKEKT
jgi:hypothetical protein